MNKSSKKEDRCEVWSVSVINKCPFRYAGCPFNHLNLEHRMRILNSERIKHVASHLVPNGRTRTANAFWFTRRRACLSRFECICQVTNSGKFHCRIIYYARLCLQVTLRPHGLFWWVFGSQSQCERYSTPFEIILFYFESPPNRFVVPIVNHSRTADTMLRRIWGGWIIWMVQMSSEDDGMWPRAERYQMPHSRIL